MAAGLPYRLSLLKLDHHAIVLDSILFMASLADLRRAYFSMHSILPLRRSLFLALAQSILVVIKIGVSHFYPPRLAVCTPQLSPSSWRLFYDQPHASRTGLWKCDVRYAINFEEKSQVARCELDHSSPSEMSWSTASTSLQ